MLDVEKMTDAELEEELAAVVESIAQITGQLDFAKSDAAATGVYRDRDWFNRARYAKRMAGVDHQSIMRELGKRRRQKAADLQKQNTWSEDERLLRQQRLRSIDRLFVDVAKERLSANTFADLMAEANERGG